MLEQKPMEENCMHPHEFFFSKFPVRILLRGNRLKCLSSQTGKHKIQRYFSCEPLVFKGDVQRN